MDSLKRLTGLDVLTPIKSDTVSPKKSPNNKANDEKVLYSFNFIGSGSNAVFAANKEEAIAQAKREFPDFASRIDEKSFVRRDTLASQDAYWNSLEGKHRSLNLYHVGHEHESQRKNKPTRVQR